MRNWLGIPRSNVGISRAGIKRKANKTVLGIEISPVEKANKNSPPFRKSHFCKYKETPIRKMEKNTNPQFRHLKSPFRNDLFLSI
jgi:hypothetical protein